MDPLVAYVYLYVILLPLLDVGAFYFTYRVRKITGAFRGWNLMLLFVVLFCLQGLGTFFGGAVVAIFYPSQLESYVTKAGATSIIGSSAYNLVVAGVLLAAMFEIYRVFVTVQAKRAIDPIPISQ